MFYLGAIGLMYIITMLMMLAVALGFYLMGAIGAYTIAKKRGYGKPYLGYIPIAKDYLLGAIADNINWCYNKKTSFRAWLLIGNSMCWLSAIFGIVLAVIFISSNTWYISDGFNAALLISYVLLLLGSTATTVLKYIVLYKIFNDYSPKNAVLFLVLSIFLGIYTVFLFAIRSNPSSSAYYSYQARYGSQQPQYQQPQYNDTGSSGSNS